MLPSLKLLPALGISIFVHTIFPIRTLSKKEFEDIENQTSDERSKIDLMNGFIHGLVLLCNFIVGYIVHWFMG